MAEESESNEDLKAKMREALDRKNKKSKGVRSLTVNGKQIAGNLLPLAELAEGAVVEARIDGPASA